MMLALTIGALVSGAAYLLLDRSYLRSVLGFLMLGHAVNLVLFSAGGVRRRGEPLEGTDAASAADPLPQAFALTAIVIAFAVTVVMLVLAVTGRPGDDTTLDAGDPAHPAGDGDTRDRAEDSDDCGDTGVSRNGAAPAETEVMR
jgi:multicomponent Na+:H+ antiporter subunit C